MKVPTRYLRYVVEPCDNLGSLNPPPPRDRTWIVRDCETGQQQSEHDRRAEARAEAFRLNNVVEVSPSTTDATARVQSIMEPFAQPWRWFHDGAWIVLEPPQALITSETMHYVSQCPGTRSVEAVFRATPSPGVYLRFRLRDLAPAQDSTPTSTPTQASAAQKDS